MKFKISLTGTVKAKKIRISKNNRTRINFDKLYGKGSKKSNELD